MTRLIVAAGVIALLVAAAPRAEESPADAQRRRTLDTILDTNVRDGYVYYRALKQDRSKLDGYLSLLAGVEADKLSREEQIAFWVNAYNAIVLRTVIDHYPIQRRTPLYPDSSIRQIPGAFERLQYRVAGRMLTLDQIEQTILPTFHDPRIFFALGRGAVGSGRLRSEAFDPAQVEMQLSEVASECTSRPECVRVDVTTNKLLTSAIFSWREADFVAAYGSRAPAIYASRSPVERAILAFVDPRLLTTERELLTKNTFQVAYAPFDWSLNDLTGRGGR